LTTRRDDFRYELFAALVACAAIILFVFVYRSLTSSDRELPDDESTANQEMDHGGRSAGAPIRMSEGHPLKDADRLASVSNRPAASGSRPGGRTPGHAGGFVADASTPLPGGAGNGKATAGTTPGRATPRAGAAPDGTPIQASKSLQPTPFARGAGSGAANEDSSLQEPTPLPGSGDLSISGRILNQAKEPVPGIEVTASGSPSQPELAGGSGTSGNDGRYEIRGLAEGEYHLVTTATERYRSGETVARAGFSSADIILEGDYEIRVVGTVTDADGNPIAGVRVVPADLQRQTQTDGSGNYSAFLVIKWTEGTYAFQFLAKGYRDKLVYVKGADIAGLQETRVDAQLESAGDTTVVSGVVRAADGTPVAGVSVQLQSSELGGNYRGTSGPDGRFTIADVRTGTDYRVTAIPGKAYRDYLQQPVAIAAGAFLDIALESLDTGRLTGRMVDAEGTPIGRFGLWLTSSDARAQPVQVVSDDGGSFSVDQAPAGQASCSTRSAPQLAVNGITIVPGETQDVLLVLDWGDLLIEGHVIDDRGSPVAGAQVALSWSSGEGGLSSSSSRTAVTDPGGLFRFTQLGPGPHQLSVGAPGRGGAPQRIEVAAGNRDVEVTVP
jgi:hypothetical protein